MSSLAGLGRGGGGAAVVVVVVVLVVVTGGGATLPWPIAAAGTEPMAAAPSTAPKPIRTRSLTGRILPCGLASRERLVSGPRACRRPGPPVRGVAPRTR